jgi:hypothetical protein
MGRRQNNSNRRAAAPLKKPKSNPALQQPIASAAYLLAPFALLFLAPTTLIAIFVGRLYAKRTPSRRIR